MASVQIIVLWLLVLMYYNPSITKQEDFQTVLKRYSKKERQSIQSVETKMLFKKNNRSFKFHLLGLSEVEFSEINGLIIAHGGEVCPTRNPPTITFSNNNGYTGSEPIFHINYIRECIFRGELLDLINFKLGVQGFYGCLMSIFMHGENLCSFIQGGNPCCMSTQIDLSEERWSPVTEEHNYAQGDCLSIEQTNTSMNMLPAALDSLPQDSQRISDETVLDSQFLPDESLSPANSSIPENTNRLEKTRGNNINLNVPEPTGFEELSFLENSHNLNQSENQNTSPPRKSPKMFSETSTNLTQSKGITDDEHIIQQILPSLNINTVCSPSKSMEETAVCDDVPGNAEQEKKILLGAESLQVQTSELETLNIRTISPIFGLSNVKAKVTETYENAFMEDQSFAAGWSRHTISPTILRDETNQVKILGKTTTESIREITEFVLESSDSDETIYNLSTDFEHRRSVERSSPKIRKARSKKKILKKDEVKPGRSRESDISEDSDETVIIDNNERTSQQSKLKEGSDEDTSPSQKITPKVLNEEENTVVSSTRSSDEVIPVGRNDFDTPIDSQAASSSCRKATSSSICSKKTLNQKENPKKVIQRKKYPVVPSRNFHEWEQCEMVKYLIDKSCISDAKGNLVWKQMITDGHLRHRTFQSLNNHFRRYILPNIEQFDINREDMKRFKKLL